MSLHAENDRLSAWVGSLPEGWRCDWLKWHVDCSTARPTDEQQAALPYLSNEDIESWTGRLLREDLAPAEVDSRLFKAGDVLFNKLRPYLAKVFRAEFDGVSSGELLCLRPSDRVDARYLFYVLTSHGLIDSVDAQTFGSKMPRADWEIIGHQPLPLPHVDVQRRIANFLDEKTAQIDALIDKKRALLERFAEHRQALITRAVTKGLNSDVPMRSSGVDWFGDIPAHWGVRRLSFMCEVIDCKHRTPEYVEDGVPLVSTSEIKPYSINYETRRRVDWSEYQLMSEGGRRPLVGDLIYSRNASVGSAALVRSAEDICLGQDLCLIRPHSIDQRYMEFFLNSDAGLEQLGRMLVGATFKRVNVDVVSKFIVLEPSRGEQSEIVEFLAHRLSDEDIFQKNVVNSLKLMSDYRFSLITSAITGQLPELNG
jgi:type I restriction enzyme S subunit